MCIIVAKPAKTAMPSLNTLETCFRNNPDGAGIMLASKGKVWGFKGLMTFDALKSKLKTLESRFGSLDKLPVVLHFRIGTHGKNIPENTHPFPLSDRYDELRSLEWVSSQGMAHNGIIHECGQHKDVRTENVSDTMVFVKRVVSPIARVYDIACHRDILDGLGLMAGSKLAFLGRKGIIARYGDFTKEDGVYYSNDSFKKIKPKSGFKLYAKAGTSGMFADRWSDFDQPMADIRLSREDEAYLKKADAEDQGLIEVDGVTILDFMNARITLDDDYRYDPSDASLWKWDSYDYEWYPEYGETDYTLVDEEYTEER